MTNQMCQNLSWFRNQNVSNHLTTDSDNPDPRLIRTVRDKAWELASRFASDHPEEQYDCLRQIIMRIEVHPGRLLFELDREYLCYLLGCDVRLEGDHGDAKRPLTIDVPFIIKRRGVEARVVLGDSRSASPFPDDNLTNAIAKAHGWFEQLTSGKAGSIQERAIAGSG